MHIFGGVAKVCSARCDHVETVVACVSADNRRRVYCCECVRDRYCGLSQVEVSATEKRLQAMFDDHCVTLSSAWSSALPPQSCFLIPGAAYPHQVSARVAAHTVAGREG